MSLIFLRMNQLCWGRNWNMWCCVVSELGRRCKGLFSVSLPLLGWHSSKIEDGWLEIGEFFLKVLLSAGECFVRGYTGWGGYEVICNFFGNGICLAVFRPSLTLGENLLEFHFLPWVFFFLLHCYVLIVMQVECRLPMRLLRYSWCGVGAE